MTVWATDSTGYYDTVSVSVEVTNVDEEGTLVLTQETLSTGPELTGVLTDPDGSIREVTWQWSVSLDETAWKEILGSNSASYAPTSEELSHFLRVQAKYTDGHGLGKVAEATLPNFWWTSGSNHPPEFPFTESGVRSVSTNGSKGQEIGRPVLASDLDRDILTYSLSGDASQLFAIGSHTGQLKTKSNLSHQLEGTYFGLVHVSDGRGGSASKVNPH